jgi:hypothetical protein
MKAKTMAKKLSSIFLTLAMLFTFLPVMRQSAYAAEDNTPPAVDFNTLKVTLPGGKDSIIHGESVHFSIKVTDDSPFNYRDCAAIYKVPGVSNLKRVYMEAEDYNEKTGFWECDIAIDEEGLLPGLYQLSGIIFSDSKGNINQVWNSACYSDDRPLVDLSAGDFMVTAVCTKHQWEQKIQKATPTKAGCIYQQCSVCGAEETIAPLLKVSNIELEGASYTYSGKAITPKVTVGNGSELLSTDNYTVSYSNNVKVGTATAKITLKGDYYEGTKNLTFEIIKASQTVTVPKTAYTKTYGNAAFSLAAKTNGDGVLTYASDNTKVAAVDKSTGKVTLKGVGNATITITAAATNNYKKATKMVTVTVKKPTVKATSVSKLINVKGKKMTVQWKKVSPVTGYQIQYTTDSKFKKSVKTISIKSAKTTSNTIAKLTKKKKYYVRIRTYRTVSKKNFYSGWSKAKAVTIKK